MGDQKNSHTPSGSSQAFVNGSCLPFRGPFGSFHVLGRLPFSCGGGKRDSKLKDERSAPRFSGAELRGDPGGGRGASHPAVHRRMAGARAVSAPEVRIFVGNDELI